MDHDSVDISRKDVDIYKFGTSGDTLKCSKDLEVIKRKKEFQYKTTLLMIKFKGYAFEISFEAFWDDALCFL